MTSLPASDLIETGLRDLREQRETVPALLVSVGAPKLRSLGIDVSESLPTIPNIVCTIYSPPTTLIPPTPNTTP